jgi:hypothetical protein
MNGEAQGTHGSDVSRLQWDGERTSRGDLREAGGLTIVEYEYHDVRPIVVLDLEHEALE